MLKFKKYLAKLSKVHASYGLVMSITASLFLLMNCSNSNTQSPADSLQKSPNFLFIFVDDLRYDTLGVSNPLLSTPAIDSIAKSGMRFDEAFSVLSVCSPSRATVLTGRYPSSHGVTTFGNTPVNPNNPSFVLALKEGGYQTAVVGKWHLGNEPQDMGFDTADIFHGNGKWYGRAVIEDGVETIANQFIETWSVDRSLKFLDEVASSGEPFFLWHNTQVPHLNHQFEWPATKDALAGYDAAEVPLPASYPPDLESTGKPPYLKASRSYVKAMDEYGYRSEAALRTHIKEYYASITDLDAELGRLLEGLAARGLAENTYVIFLSDNGWQLGEHGLTSKVLAYDKSMKVPLFISGPGLSASRNRNIVTNADMAPLILDLAGIGTMGYDFHGRSFSSLLKQETSPWRDYFYYESPTPQLIPRAFYAVRDASYVYIETYGENSATEPEFVELYDLKADPDELNNLALNASYDALVANYADQLQSERRVHGSL